MRGKHGNGAEFGVSSLKRRRSFVLIAVLVVVGSALLVATSLLFLAQPEATGAAGAGDAAQAQALAWSGVKAVLTRLDDQRDRILNGELPRLDSQYTIYETRQRQGIVRLLPMNAKGDQVFATESGKLDLNTVDAATLARTGMIDPAAAAAIISYREQTLRRPFQSVEELLNVPSAGVTAETLYGPIEDVTPVDDANPDQRDVGGRIKARLKDDSVRGLADVLTVFSCEPALQSNGKLRINLNAPWSAALSDRIEERFGHDAAVFIEKLRASGVTYENEARIFQSLRQLKSPPENWPEIVDAFTTDAAENSFGRLDINTAPYEALLALPGMTAEKAAQMVSVREELSSQEKATVAWPVIAQIIAPEAIDQLAGKITTRCWMYRVRIAAGEVEADHPDAAMTNPMVYEAVIDLSSPRARIAYLRDISQLQVAAKLAWSASLSASPQFAKPQGEMNRAEGEADGLLPATTAPEATKKTAGGGAGKSGATKSNQSGASSAVTSPTGDATAEAAAPAPSQGSPSDARRRIGRWLSGG